MKIAVIGAGLAGATVTFKLAAAGHSVEVFDQRGHIAGNVYTDRDPATGIMVHRYGPHIFHTDSKVVWDWMRSFCEMMPYIQRTKAISGGNIYSLPINLHTINQIYGGAHTPDEARELLQRRRLIIPGVPQNFEDAALSTIGPELYEAFIRDYTRKQWGRDPRDLPASIFSRLPIRFGYSDNAFTHPYQGMPRHGYTSAVWNMLDHPEITIRLGERVTAASSQLESFGHIFNSSPLDEWFDSVYGSLSYRTLDFETIHLDTFDGQGCAVINNCDPLTKWTRSTEHKHFATWEASHMSTIITREHPRECMPGDVPFYPIGLEAERNALAQYQALAAASKRTTFIGRLGTYQYLDMDKVIKASLTVVNEFIAETA